MGNVFAHYEDIPLGYATIPTRLYRLEPIGIGTPLVESLSSYVQRLADAHGVGASNLVTYEINPLLEMGRLRPDNICVGAPSKISSISGLGHTAQEWVNAIESLTFMSGFRYLTLLPFGHLFQERDVFNKPSAWCSKCIEEWTHEGKPIYWPLIWKMQPVKICPVHMIPLESNCANCRSTSSPLRPISTPGHCPSCGRWFGYSCYQQEMPREIHYNLWAAKTVSELLAAGPRLDGELYRQAVVPEMLEYIIRTGIKRGGIRSLARIVCISAAHLTAWLEGQRLPKLRELLYICCFFKLNLLEVITKKLSGDDDRAWLDILVEENIGCGNEAGDWKSLYSLLKDVDSGKSSPMSVAELATFYKCRIASVYRRYPELCKSVSARCSHYRNRQISNS